MIPSNEDAFLLDIEEDEMSNKNYQMNINKTRVNGYCDGINSVRQSIYKILNTERYRYIIYSWGYGLQTDDLYGKPVDYVCAELQRRVPDAIEWDDRVESCDSFEFNTSIRHVVMMTCTAHSIFGDIEIKKAVNY